MIDPVRVAAVCLPGMARLCLFVAFGLVLSGRAHPEPPPVVQFHVTPDGSDAADGRSVKTAFQTIERARDAVRLINKEGLKTGPIVVNLLPGNYRIEQTIEFRTEDSGTTQNPIVYRATGPDPTRLTGSQVFKLADFAAVTEPGLLERLDPAVRGKIRLLSIRDKGLRRGGPYPAKFDDNGGLFEIFADGKRLPIARWPNGTSVTTMKKAVLNGDPRTPGIFEYRGDRPSRWLKNPNIWLKGQWRVGWEEPALKLAKIDTTSRTITFAIGIPNGIGNKYTRPYGNGEEPWFAINLPEEIDQPGEWAIDFASQSLLLYPPESNSNSELLISQLDGPVIRAQGAAHVRFERLMIDASLGDGIVLDKVDACVIAGCNIRNVARKGIVLNGSNSGIQSCDIHHVGEGCIYVSGGNRKQLTSSNNFIVNNHLHNYGALKSQYSPGIGVGLAGNPANQPPTDAVGIHVAHNSIHHAPRDAFLYSGNDNIYEYNEVYYCGFNTRDTGAFYSWLDWTMRGNIIRHNYIHDTIGGVNPDDGASGNYVFGNIFRGPRIGVWIASGPDNVVVNNIFIKPEGSVFGMDDRGVSRKYATNARLINRLKEIQPEREPWASRHPEMRGILENRPELPWRTQFSRNLIVNPKPADPELKMADEFKINPAIFKAEGNLTVAEDPGFVNAQRGVFELKPESIAFKRIKDFKPIPFSKIGLQVDAYRTTLPSEAEAQKRVEDSPYRDDDHHYGT